MSHELTQHADGRVEFAYHEEHGAGWHRLGQMVTKAEAQDVDVWRARSGMNWRVQRSRIRYAVDAAGTLQTDENNHVLFRSDTKAPLGIVSKRYQVVQPADMLELFRGLARAGGLEISAAGTLFGGRRFWATARIGESSPASMRDRVGAFLLFASSADGSSNTTGRRVATRVVCNNTMQMAYAEGAAEFTLSHRSTFDPAEVRDFMRLNTAAWDHFRHGITRLANVAVSADDAQEFALDILAPNARKSGTDAVDKVRDSAAYKRILALFGGAGLGADLDGARGTAWGLLNAFTEYADHHARAHSAENRFASAMWGDGATLKNRALAVLSA